MNLVLDPYLYLRDFVWEARAPRSAKRWRKNADFASTIVPDERDRFTDGHSIESINVKQTGEIKATVRNEIDDQIIFREFYIEEWRLTGVREYGWVVDFFLPRRAMVRWRNEIDTCTLPFRRRGRTICYSLSDSKITIIGDKIIQIVKEKIQS